jgi:hypothetical protein
MYFGLLSFRKLECSFKEPNIIISEIVPPCITVSVFCFSKDSYTVYCLKESEIYFLAADEL